MKKILLSLLIVASAVAYGQKKMTFILTNYKDESGAIVGVDSSILSYADYKGSLTAVEPTFGTFESSPLSWNFVFPTIHFTTSTYYNNGVQYQINSLTYNGQDQITTNQSSNGSRTLFTYTPTGLIASEEQQFDDGSGNYLPYSLKVNEFDAQGRLTVFTEYQYPSNVQEIFSRDSLFYFGNTTNLSKLASYQSPNGIALEASALQEYTFNGNNPATLKYSVDVDGDPQTPLEWYVDVTYNFTGQTLNSLVGMLVMNNVPTPIEAVRLDYAYNPSGKLASIVQTGQFGLGGSTFVYDADGFLTQVGNQNETSGGGASFTSSEENYEYISTASLTSQNEIELEVFPNPAQDKIQLKTDETVVQVNIVSMDGKVLMSQNGNVHQLDISFLPKGNYMFEVISTNGTATKMIVKD